MGKCFGTSDYNFSSFKVDTKIKIRMVHRLKSHNGPRLMLNIHSRWNVPGEFVDQGYLGVHVQEYGSPESAVTGRRDSEESV